jgi:P4 family phage/plasmid primase-like protien|tara:strand:- start:1066 stop:3066 length:2001 start_codon:yes stop_codon:yes gene_type:complete
MTTIRERTEQAERGENIKLNKHIQKGEGAFSGYQITKYHKLLISENLKYVAIAQDGGEGIHNNFLSKIEINKKKGFDNILRDKIVKDIVNFDILKKKEAFPVVAKAMTPLALAYNRFVSELEEKYRKKGLSKDGEVINTHDDTQRIKIDNYLDNAKYFYNKQPYFYDISKIWWLWQENRWVMTDDVEMERNMDSSLGFMGQTISSGLRINHLQAMKWVGRDKKPKDSKIKWIQFIDKAFSIWSKEIHDVTPDYFFTNPIPWKIGESDKTPKMDQLFKEWVGEKYVIDLYEIIAYCCYQKYPIQTILCLQGHGRNGKSSFLKILSNFLGMENICSTELDLIVGGTSSRFETSKLYKKLVCLMGETNFGTLTKSSVLKKLTGEDVIGFEKKGKDPFDDYSYAKILIASNSLPTSDDTSDGFYRRWHIIEFPNSYPEGKDITEEIPEVEYNNLAKKVINILPVLLKRGSFTNQGTIPERQNRYIMASNPLPFFLKVCCIMDDNELTFISYGELYTSYCKFLKEHKKRKVTMKEFKSALEDEGYWIERTTKKFGESYKSNRWIDGIMLKIDWKEHINDDYDIMTNILTGNPYRESEWELNAKKHNRHNTIKAKETYDTLMANLSTKKEVEVQVFLETYPKEFHYSIEQQLEKLKSDGEIFESKPGFIKLL